MKPVGRYVYRNKMLIRAVALKYVLFSVLSPYILNIFRALITIASKH